MQCLQTLPYDDATRRYTIIQGRVTMFFRWNMYTKQNFSIKDVFRPALADMASFKNIGKDTTDLRVEFILQDHSSQFTNLEHITISESQLSINFKISTKHQHLD